MTTTSTDTNNTDTNNTNDPKNLLSQVVKITNTARDDLNNQIGTAISFSSDRNRYTVHLLPASNNTSPQQQRAQVLSFKPDNLVLGTFVDKAKFKLAEAKLLAQQVKNDPHLRRQVTTAYNTVQSRLPKNVRPEHLAGLLFVVFFYSIYQFGFSKTFLFVSLMILPLMISAPDVQAGMNVTSIARNFPRRWHAAVVQMTGYPRITEKMALGGFVLFMLLSGKVLLTPLPTTMSNKPTTTTTTTAVASALTSKTIEDMYKLGFDDAKQGLDYGHSLPPIEDELTMKPYTTTTTADNDDDLDFVYQPPPQSKAGSKFGLQTFMAFFTLYRTGKDLATGPDGSFSAPLLMVNARNLDPMRAGMLGLSVYKIVTTFLF